MPLPVDGPFAGLKIIDCDSHFSEPWDLWTSRAPKKYADDVPQVRENERGSLEWFFQGRAIYRASGGSFIDRSAHKVPIYKTTALEDLTDSMKWEDQHPAAYEPKARVEMLDKLGIYAQIVYPNTLGFGAGSLVACEDRELANTVAMIYNDAIAEFQEQGEGRLFPQALIPFWDIPAAVKEVERIHGMGLKGITMAGEPHLGGLPDLGEPEWEPLYEILSDLELPINIHIGASRFGAGAQGGPRQTFHWKSLPVREAKPVTSIQSEMQNSRFVSNILVSGMTLKYPKLKWVSVESGIGWLPYVFERIDYDYREEFPDYPDFPPPNLPPARDMFRKGMYACFWFETAGPLLLLDYIGADNILWESDFPHPTCLYPEPVERTAELMKDVNPVNVRKVMQDNAAKLYKIDVS